MVNNSTNINKTNNNFSVQIIEHKKGPQLIILALNRHKNEAGLNQLMG